MKQSTLLTGGAKKHQLLVSLRSAILFGLAVTLLYTLPKGAFSQTGAKGLLLWGMESLLQVSWYCCVPEGSGWIAKEYLTLRHMHFIRHVICCRGSAVRKNA